jgi:hypothetical protein
MKSGRRGVTPTILSPYYVVSKNIDQASKYISFERLLNQNTGVKFQKDFCSRPALADQ